MFYTCRGCQSYGYTTDSARCEECQGTGKVSLTKENFDYYLEGYRRIKEVADRLLLSFAALSGEFIPTNVEMDLTSLNETTIEYSGEEYYRGNTDYYNVEIPVQYLYDAEFRRQYFHTQVQRTREDEIETVLAGARSRVAQEIREKQLYVELKKKFGDDVTL